MRLLVVEDEPVAAALLARGLREHAYVVDVAVDGSTALENALLHEYDLIVLDVLLPGIDGCCLSPTWSSTSERGASNGTAGRFN